VPIPLHDVLLYCTAVTYLASAGLLYLSLLKPAPGWRREAIILALGGLLLHGIAQGLHWFPAGPVEVSLLNMLSLCALVVVAIPLLSLLLKSSLFDASLVTLPLATAVVLAEATLPVHGSLLTGHGPATATHIVTSVMAFGLLSMAGIYAGFVALIDHFLRHHHINRLVRALPALDVLESLLFKLIGAGFTLLTVSLASGLLFVNDLFAQHLAHKTILSITAWLIFGVLLWGRRARGWRGRTAVRLTLAGVVVLVLAYFGSKAVLEIVLQRDWQV
jgi:ABC-type uncharacterized transport system permease subunit